MPANKTTETTAPVADYLAIIADAQKREDCTALVEMMQRETSYPPKMWGTGIIGFGSYHYKYASGHEGDAPLAGLSARANAITLYLSPYAGREAALSRLGKHKESKACIHIKKLSDIDPAVLMEIVRESVKTLQTLYP
ncbi:MAG: DUF1801 domain-containing protein [Mucilaginibacter polytrichastri]|nr:DUF1801 domain-containing protein [Mucilaginibacter polytrichastri]